MKRSISFTYDLIKKLDPKEKKYIRQQIRTSGKHLFQLFVDLDKSKSYNKETFIKQNQNKAYTKNLSQNQTSLRNKIIDLLVNYSSKSIFEIDLYNQISKALILIQKKFYKQAKTVIDQSITIALHADDYAICYNLINIILRGVNSEIHFKLSKKEINDLRDNRQYYLTQLSRKSKFIKLNDIYYNVNNSVDKKRAYEDKFKELNVFKERRLENDYPYGAKRVFYFHKAQYASLSKNIEDYLFFTKKVFDLYVLNEHLIQYHFTSFLGDVINFLDSLIETENFRVFFIQHKAITDLIDAHEKEAYCLDNSKVYIIKYYFLQAAYNNARHFEKSVQFANEYLNIFKKNEIEFSNNFIIRSSVEIALAFLYNNLPEKAITNLELVINSKDYCANYTGRILNILAHYILGNKFLIDALFHSFFHYLKTVDEKEQTKNIRKLKKNIKNKTVHKLANEDFEDFVFIHWD